MCPEGWGGKKHVQACISGSSLVSETGKDRFMESYRETNADRQPCVRTGRDPGIGKERQRGTDRKAKKCRD